MASQNIGFQLSSAVRNTASPPIPQAYKWAALYSPTDDRPLIDMSQGAPKAPPPLRVLDALGKSASDPLTCGYCPMTGEPQLRAALVEEMKLIYGSDSDIVPEDVALTAGCNMAFITSIMALADTGDEVILPVPWYFNHEMTLQMLGIKAVALQTNAADKFLPSPERCSELITPKTKAIVLVTPNNPTGAIYPPPLIHAFALLARKSNIALIVDETYRDFITAGVPHSLFTPGSLQRSSNLDLPGDWSWRRHFIHLFSFSKSYSIPGHRLGAVVASSEVMEQIGTVLDCIQICPPRHVQLALHPLLPSLRAFIRETALALEHRHQLFKSLLPKDWELGSQGGYYAFVKHPFRGVSSTDVCRKMATHFGVVTLPAAFFIPRQQLVEPHEDDSERDQWIRFSIANVDDANITMILKNGKFF